MILNNILNYNRSIAKLNKNNKNVETVIIDNNPLLGLSHAIIRDKELIISDKSFTAETKAGPLLGQVRSLKKSDGINNVSVGVIESEGSIDMFLQRNTIVITSHSESGDLISAVQFRYVKLGGKYSLYDIQGDIKLLKIIPKFTIYLSNIEEEDVQQLLGMGLDYGWTREDMDCIVK